MVHFLGNNKDDDKELSYPKVHITDAYDECLFSEASTFSIPKDCTMWKWWVIYMVIGSWQWFAVVSQNITHFEWYLAIFVNTNLFMHSVHKCTSSLQVRCVCLVYWLLFKWLSQPLTFSVTLPCVCCYRCLTLRSTVDSELWTLNSANRSLKPLKGQGFLLGLLFLQVFFVVNTCIDYWHL